MIDDRLVSALRVRKLLLFAGAGVSRNLELPSWDGLADEVAKKLHFDAEIFKAQGTLLELFEYYYLETGSLGPLRSWMDSNWHNGIEIGTSDIHRLIVELQFPKIYTTNFDSWIERAYEYHGRRFHKVTNAVSMRSSHPGESQIVKFHGDFDDDESLVLTESNYFERLSFESPLDIQLRADMLSHSFLYVGYSMQDINLRFLLYKLHKQTAQVKNPSAVPPSFVLLSRPNIIAERILTERNVVPIVSSGDDPGESLKNFLSELYARVSEG